MKLEIKPTNSTEYYIRFECGDEMYHRCMWARVVLDHDNYTLFAETDCGNYTYGWKPTPNSESFLELMSRVDAGYLLSKIADISTFLLKESKQHTIENVRESYDHLSEKELDNICEQIQDIDDVGYEEFFRKVEDILDCGDYSDTFEIIQIEKDYPTRAKTFARIFCEVVQPAIKKTTQENKPCQS